MPSNEVPAALQEFIKHRQHLKNKETAPAVKKKLGLTDHKGKAELEQGIEGIIDKKPNKKVVMEFFKERVKDLTATKMK
mgnify:CR=1 FL=1|jgi:hypothetical protein